MQRERSSHTFSSQFFGGMGQTLQEEGSKRKKLTR